jgi:hypothetical protein
MSAIRRDGSLTAHVTQALPTAPLPEQRTQFRKLRVVTWNLETVGTSGSAPYQAVAAVLGRIDADVVAINLRHALPIITA